MMTIFAKSMFTATRMDGPRAPSTKPERPDQPRKRRWLPEGHWWLNAEKDADLSDL